MKPMTEWNWKIQSRSHMSLFDCVFLYSKLSIHFSLYQLNSIRSITHTHARSHLQSFVSGIEGSIAKAVLFRGKCFVLLFTCLHSMVFVYFDVNSNGTKVGNNCWHSIEWSFRNFNNRLSERTGEEGREKIEEESHDCNKSLSIHSLIKMGFFFHDSFSELSCFQGLTRENDSNQIVENH